MPRPNGFSIYRGPSALNGDPIVAILTGLDRPSVNVKTGPSLQLWILPDPTIYGLPQHAAKEGADEAVCGGCRHRPVNGGTCYVTLFQGPRAVADAFLRGAYPAIPNARKPWYTVATPTDDGTLQLLDAMEHAYDRRGVRLLRLGAWGDPAALPCATVTALVDAWRRTGDRASWTGYTHQWRRPEARWLQPIAMASADSPQDRRAAHVAGWRTFHVLGRGERPQGRDIVCPATRPGSDVTCAACTLCSGTSLKAARSIAVAVHGARANAFRPAAAGADR